MAARLCAAALGTDTLASVRMPAAYCGVVGVKPSNGLTPIRGIIPVSESLDCVGPLCREVADTAFMLAAMAGHDPLDPVSLDVAPPDFSDALNRPVRGWRLGLPAGGYWGNLQPDVERATREAMELLEGMGAEIHEVQLPPTPDFIALLAEAYAWHRPYLEDAGNHPLYAPVTVERLRAAGEVSMPEYYEGRRQLALARKAIDAVFTEVDLLLTPTTPALPETIDQAQNPASAEGAEDSARNLFMFNLYGTPALSLPCGFSGNGLPIGLQISGARLGEVPMLALAQAYQQASDWHTREPAP